MIISDIRDLNECITLLLKIYDLHKPAVDTKYPSLYRNTARLYEQHKSLIANEQLRIKLEGIEKIIGYEK